jgi:hypothetical protein
MMNARHNNSSNNSINNKKNIYKEFLLKEDVYMEIKTDETVLIFSAYNERIGNSLDWHWVLNKNDEIIDTGTISSCLEKIFSDYDVKGINLIPTRFDEHHVLQYLIMVKI